MNNYKMCFACFLGFFLFLAISAFSDTVYQVRLDGAGDYPSLQACNDANGGSYTSRGTVTCLITQAGSYTATLTVTGQTNVSATNHIKFASSLPLGQVMLVFNASVGINILSSYTEISNLYIANIFLSGDAIRAEAVGVVIDRCYIQPNGTTGYGVTGRTSASFTVKNTAINGSGQTGAGEGIYVYQTSTGTFKNCTIYGFARGIADEGSGPNTITSVNMAINTNTGFVGAFAGGNTQSYNYCKDATCTGTGSVNNVTFDLNGYIITTRSNLYRKGTPQTVGDISVNGFTWNPWSVGAYNPGRQYRIKNNRISR